MKKFTESIVDFDGDGNVKSKVCGEFIGSKAAVVGWLDQRACRMDDSVDSVGRPGRSHETVDSSFGTEVGFQALNKGFESLFELSQLVATTGNHQNFGPTFGKSSSDAPSDPR